MEAIASLLPNESCATLPKANERNSSAVPIRTAEASAKPVLSSTVTRTLWVRMAEAYGSRWTSSYGDNPNQGAALTWAKGLAGLTGEQLAGGIGACIACADPWPPTLPEFRMRCLGIPSFAAVRADSARQDGFTRLVWQYLDGHRYRMSSAEHADRLLREAYDQAKEHLMRGGELPAAPVGEIQQERRDTAPATREQVQGHMADIARELGLSASEAEAMGADGVLQAGE